MLLWQLSRRTLLLIAAITCLLIILFHTAYYPHNHHHYLHRQSDRGDDGAATAASSSATSQRQEGGGASSSSHGRHAGTDDDGNDDDDSTSSKMLLLPEFHRAGDKTNLDSKFRWLRSHFRMRTHPQQHDDDADDGKNNVTAVYPTPIDVHYIRQIHHGIYECRAKVPSVSDGGDDGAGNGNEKASHHRGGGGGDDEQEEVTFAFKTECRPASKWHGQQGYTEVLVNRVIERLFGAFAIGPFTPGAVGGIVRLAEKFHATIHRDGCGFLTDSQVSAMYGSNFLRTTTSGGGGAGLLTSRLLIGVILQWKPRHNDNAIPPVSFLTDVFSVSSSSSSSSSSSPHATKRLSPISTKRTSTTKEELLQVSDIFCLDYIVGNEDRLDKNWFKDDQGRFIAMDNGWALAGLNYAGSVCDRGEENLKCPPLFRGRAHSMCKRQAIANCRFRKSTAKRVKKLAAAAAAAAVQASSSSSSLTQQLAHDPLLAFLAEFYPGVVERRRKNGRTRYWSSALARFVDECDHHDGDDDAVNGGGNTNNNKKKQKHGAASSVVVAFSASSPSSPFKMIDRGLSVRLRRLRSHIEECVDRFGESDVLL